MKVWEKTKKFCREHKTVVVSSAVGIASFIGGWILRKKITDDVVDVIKTGADMQKELLEQYQQELPPFQVTDEQVKDFEEEQKELKEKYGNDFAILEEVVKNLTEPENGKLWMIENGRVALIDGIESDVTAEES